MVGLYLEPAIPVRNHDNNVVLVEISGQIAHSGNLTAVPSDAEQTIHADCRFKLLHVLCRSPDVTHACSESV